jgi:predicted RNA binding protein YcfA (HicA-like mRNA interferase family)
MKGYYAQVTKLLRDNSFTLLRAGKGSHEIWSNGSIHLTVPFGCKSRHTANAILKDAGIDQKV